MGARATVMVAGTAAAVSVALANGRRLTPVFVEAAPAPRPSFATVTGGASALSLPDPRAFVARRFALATLLAVAGIVLVATVAAVISIGVPHSSSASSVPSTSSAVDALAQGPSADLRPATGLATGFDEAYSAAIPSADAVGGTLLAAAEEKNAQEFAAALQQLYDERQARQAAVSASRSPNGPQSLNTGSGYAAGTVLQARITVYGCVGAGGGFCNNMSTGIPVFEGAAACSPDLPFGTKLRIAGDPTGRVYECLDRGALANTWIDVFFYNTADGIAWQSLLGGTVTNIEIVN